MTDTQSARLVNDEFGNFTVEDRNRQAGTASIIDSRGRHVRVPLSRISDARPPVKAEKW